MKYFGLWILVAVTGMATTVCGGETQQAVADVLQPRERGAVRDVGHPSTAGRVIETMNAGSYTYVHVDTGVKKIWAAAPRFDVAPGDEVLVPKGTLMMNFYSKTLDRTFELIHFVPQVHVIRDETAKRQIQAAHGGFAAEAAPSVDLTNIQKAAGGYTVQELFAKRRDLDGREVLVRGRVTKFTPAVRGKNWIHLRDGTGKSGMNDLTVTTGTTAEIGDTVLVRGRLATDKNFGFGYRYDVIILDADVKVE